MNKHVMTKRLHKHTLVVNIKDSSIELFQKIVFLLQILAGILFFAGLLFSFTNKFIIYPVLFFLALVIFSLLIVGQVRKISIPHLWFSLVVLGVYFLFSAIISRLPIRQILSYDFIRYDGNFFVSFFPLFFLPILMRGKIVPQQQVIKYVQGIIWAIAGITGFLTMSFLLHHPIGSVDMYGIYFYLFKAHNAAGSFYLVMFFVSLLLFLNPKFTRSRLGNLLATVSFFIALWFSRSRGSLFGVLWALAILFVEHVRPLKYFKQLIIAGMLFVLILFNFVLLGWGYKGWVDLGRPEHSFFEDKALPTFLNTLSAEKYERFENIADRVFYLWPRALDDFVKSPLIGIGFTRFNDVPMYLEGIPHYVMLNTTQLNIVFSSAHAHHTFLHILAETGLVGLFLLIVFIVDMFVFVSSIDSPLSAGIYYALWGMIGASFTEHRFFTPSGMLVISILIVIAYLSRIIDLSNISTTAADKT